MIWRKQVSLLKRPFPPICLNRSYIYSILGLKLSRILRIKRKYCNRKLYQSMPEIIGNSVKRNWIFFRSYLILLSVCVSWLLFLFQFKSYLWYDQVNQQDGSKAGKSQTRTDHRCAYNGITWRLVLNPKL